MLLKIQLEPGAKLVLDLRVRRGATVAQLKDAIHALNKGKDRAHLHCVFKHASAKYPEILEDDKTLAEYNVADGDRVKYLYQQASTGDAGAEGEAKQ